MDYSFECRCARSICKNWCLRPNPKK